MLSLDRYVYSLFRLIEICAHSLERAASPLNFLLHFIWTHPPKFVYIKYVFKGKIFHNIKLFGHVHYYFVGLCTNTCRQVVKYVFDFR